MNFRQFMDLVEVYNWDESTLLLELFDKEKFLDRAKAVQALINRGATDGERAAAQAAMDRLIARAQDEGEYTADLKARLDAIRSQTTQQTEPARKRQHSYGDWAGGAQQQRRSQEDADAAYARKQEKARQDRARQERADREDRDWRDQQNRSAGSLHVWDYARFVEGTSNKVYGVCEKNGRYFTFWGRHGGSLAVKEFGGKLDAMDVFYSKIKKGYERTGSRGDMRWIESALAGKV